eukprot:TRINITY_DN63663_c0_g1_i1.p1 TRINITY_DN63663_c0_g1~~TRINITY_DN63663_c0_g1_i1.p1  ORF type:complete len:662 (-),score=104.50 TRINITY_DN63663_c0_g1_i1:163-2148(-)
MWWNTGPHLKRRMAKERGEYGMRDSISYFQDLTGIEELKEILRSKYGTLTRAWRVAFDTDSNGLIDAREFVEALSKIGFIGNRRSLWCNLDADQSGFISLAEVDLEAATKLERFRVQCVTKFGSMEAAWNECLDVNRSGGMSLAEFLVSSETLGYTCHDEVRELFDLLRTVPGTWSIGLHDLIFLQHWEDRKQVSVARSWRAKPRWVNKDPFLFGDPVKFRGSGAKGAAVACSVPLGNSGVSEDTAFNTDKLSLSKPQRPQSPPPRCHGGGHTAGTTSVLHSLSPPPGGVFLTSQRPPLSAVVPPPNMASQRTSHGMTARPHPSADWGEEASSRAVTPGRHSSRAVTPVPPTGADRGRPRAASKSESGGSGTDGGGGARGGSNQATAPASKSVEDGQGIAAMLWHIPIPSPSTLATTSRQLEAKRPDSSARADDVIRSGTLFGGYRQARCGGVGGEARHHEQLLAATFPSDAGGPRVFAENVTTADQGGGRHVWEDIVKVDQCLSWQSFLDFLRERYGSLPRAFDILDASGDGYLSQNEFLNILTRKERYCRASEALRLFDVAVAKGGQGTLSWSNFGITVDEWRNYQFDKQLQGNQTLCERQMQLNGSRLHKARADHEKRMKEPGKKPNEAFSTPLERGWGFPPLYDPPRTPIPKERKRS